MPWLPVLGGLRPPPSIQNGMYLVFRNWFWQKIPDGAFRFNGSPDIHKNLQRGLPFSGGRGIWK